MSTRYSRNLLLDGFGSEGQSKLTQARVLLIGAGALGTAAAPYLAGSGVGHIGLADFDTVDLSNLQRQPAFSEADLGQPKAATLAARLRALNSEIGVEVHPLLITAKNCDAILADYDVVLEGSDNPSTKYLIADACAWLGKACVIGGVAQYEGQVSTYVPTAMSYREIFPEAAPQCGFTPCALGGVFGPLTGIIGSVMAAEAIKVITGIGETLANRLLLMDARTMAIRVIRLR